jgi:hypothetical protein
MVEVVVADEFRAWYEALTVEEQQSVQRLVGMLETDGVALGYPYSSALLGTEHPIRELRIQHQGRPYRVLYAFDPLRQAVLLIGADKTGRDRFYEEIVPVAEQIWERYLRETR